MFRIHRTSGFRKILHKAWDKVGTLQGGESDEETLEMFRPWMDQIVPRMGVCA